MSLHLPHNGCRHNNPPLRLLLQLLPKVTLRLLREGLYHGRTLLRHDRRT